MIDKDDVEIRRHLKKFVRERLEELSMSPAELARTVNVNQSQVHRVMNGMNTPSMSFARKLARALQCDANALFGIHELVESE